MKYFYSLLLCLFLFGSNSFAEVPPLSDPIGELIHPIVDDQSDFTEDRGGDVTTMARSRRSDMFKMLEIQTNVRNQGQRNTCTVFSITAVLESLFLKKYKQYRDVNFSEQWLQYLVALRSPSGGGNGSTVPINFRQIKKYGLPNESDLSYGSKLWVAGSAEAKRNCSGHTGLNFKRCLSSHISPYLMTKSDSELINKNQSRFVKARQAARDSKGYLVRGISGGIVSSSSRIKSRLLRNIPLSLEINIYYGAWNISSAERLGIEHSPRAYERGEVYYPERGSMDRLKSPNKRARHSVEIIGYDDDVTMTYTKKMTDGSSRSFTRKGVYYFKNSWGTKRFGKSFRYQSQRLPGFGMISQDYAHEMGQFFAIDLAQ